MGRLFGSGAGGSRPPAAVLAVEGLFSALVLNLATAYTTMFASRLGANDNQIGLFSALPQLVALIVLLPGTLLAGRLTDRRRPVEISLLAAGFLYGLAGFSPYLRDIRVWYLLGVVSLANAPVALYNTSWQNYFSDIIPAAERNAAYSRRTSRTFIVSIIVIQLTGSILGGVARDAVRITLYQACYWLAMLCSLLQWLVLRRAPPDCRRPATAGGRDLRRALRELRSARPFLVFCAISLLTHAGWYLAWPLFFITQVQYMGANEAWLSYITVSGNLAIWLTVRFWSRYIEKHGIRFTLIIGCLSLAANPLLTVSALYLPAGWALPVLVVFSVVSNAAYNPFQLSILQCLLEVVPETYKPLNLSFYTSLLLLANTVMPIIGIRLYACLGSDLRAITLAMLISGLVRLGGAGLFAWRWYRLRREPDSGRRS